MMERERERVREARDIMAALDVMSAGVIAGHGRPPTFAFHNSRTAPSAASGILLVEREDGMLVWPSSCSSIGELLSNLSEEKVSTLFQRREHILNDFGSNEAGCSHPCEEFLERGEVDLHAGNGSPQGIARKPIL